MEQKIGIITFPVGKAGVIPLSNLIDILHSLYNNIYLITGNEGYLFFQNDKRLQIYCVNHDTGLNEFTKILNFVLTQIKIAVVTFKTRKYVDTYILFIGGDSLIFTMLLLKLLSKNVILAPVEDPSGFKKNPYSKLLKKLTSINRFLSDKIIVHSPIIIDKWNLHKYLSKILIAHEYFIDLNMFVIKNKYNQRKNRIGYIGRLNEEKGVLNFLKAIKTILAERNDFEFIIGGDGPLFEQIENYLLENYLQNKVKLIGWIPHHKLPEYMNELKLLVIPSYYESGPIIALESMACGTPIVASRVGHILHLIEDNNNGFIMTNNSPACISETVLRALRSQNIDEIIINGRRFVEDGFNFNAAAESYKKILQD